jgi:tetratricopeptide (TPR) repeat protein
LHPDTRLSPWWEEELQQIVSTMHHCILRSLITHRRDTRLIAFLASVVLVSGCAGDPAARKQEHFQQGNQYFDQGQYSHAIIEYRNAIALDGSFAAARKRLGETYARVGETRAALDEYVRAADLLPNDIDVQIDAGSLLLAVRKPEEALARAEAALKVDPSNVQALVLRGGALAGMTSYKEALKSVEDAIQLDPDRGRTYATLGVLKRARGQQDEAEAAFRKAVELSPKDVEVYLSLGNFYWAVGRQEDAERTFLQALEVEPSNAAANRFMASLTLAMGKKEDAEPYLRRIADGSKELVNSLALVDYYLRTDRPQDAMARLDAVPNGRAIPPVALRIARAQAAAGRRDEAKTLVEEILKNNPKDADAHLLKSRLLLQDGAREEAFAAVRAATSADGSSAEAQFALGRAYAQRGDIAAAEAAFREVLRINPRAAAAQAEVARLQTQTGKLDESLSTAGEAVRIDPRNLLARIELVRSLIAAKDHGRADREVARLKADFPDSSAVYVQEGRLAIQRNDFSRAQTALLQADGLAPGSIDTLRAFLELDLKRNDFASARARLEASLQKGNSPQLLLLAGRTYLTMKDEAAGEKTLRAATEADPSLLPPYGLLGDLYLSQKKLDMALQQFEALASRQEKPVAALTMVGMILKQQGKNDLAKKRYEDALTIDPRAATAANNLAWMLAEEGGDLDRALQFAQTATEASPNTPDIQHTLGWIYYKKEFSQQAIYAFARAIELNSSVGGYHYHLGLAYIQAGDTPRGRAALERALRTGVDGATAADIQRLLGGATASR